MVWADFQLLSMLFLPAKSWYDLGMIDLLEQSLRAKYLANKNLFVVCYLDVIEATADGFKAQVGIRVPGDTIIPVGTRLYLQPDGGRVKVSASGEFELYYVIAQGVEISDHLPVQVCSPIYREAGTNRRRVERIETDFDVTVQEIGDVPFKVVEGSHKGLTLEFKATGLFVGVVLGSEYHLNLNYKGQAFTLPVQVNHIHYDWHCNQHRVGVKILQLHAGQEAILSKLLEPTKKLDLKQKALVDTDEARIRPE